MDAMPFLHCRSNLFRDLPRPGSRFLAGLAAVLLAGVPLSRADRSTPLAATADATGTLLQNTFISAPPDSDVGVRGSFVAYRKTFTLPTAPKSASLDLFADARYLLWINGRPAGRGPNRFELRGPRYDTIDAQPYLQEGENTLAILVMGNKGTGGGHNARMMANDPGLTARLVVDGQTVLATDETWKWSDRTRYRPAAIDWAKIMDRIDARVEDGDWTLPGYEDGSWRTAVRISGDSWGPLTASRTAPLRDTPVPFRLADGRAFPVTLSEGQELRFTVGRLVLAYSIVELDAEEGTEIDFRYAGVQYTAKAGRQTFISSDTCAFDNGTIKVKRGRATIHSLQLVERLYPFDLVGRFTSSDPVLNQIWAVSARSLQIFSEDAYTDCADRERAEWMDNDPPAFAVTRTAFSAPGPDGEPRYADARLLGEMLRRTALTRQKDGWVKAHTCSDRFDIHARMEDRSCEWVQGALRYYESTGDAGLIREIWPVIVDQLNELLARRTERGLVRSREWVVWGNPIGYLTCEGTGLNAFLYKALVDAAILGEAVGDGKNAVKFRADAAALARAVNSVLWDEAAGTYFSAFVTPEDLERAKADRRTAGMNPPMENNRIGPTPFAALWALDQGLVPPDRRDRVLAYLLAGRDQVQTHHIMGYYYLFRQLYALDGEAYDREILDTIRTRWKTMVQYPWGTTWEALEFTPQFRGSRAHIYGMVPGYFLSAYVLGVRPQMPASAKRLLIEPRLGDLTAAEGVVVTEFGPVPVAWRRDGNALNFRVEIPAGVTTTLRVPRTSPSDRLTLDGAEPKVREDGRYLEVSLSAGQHQGRVAAP